MVININLTSSTIVKFIADGPDASVKIRVLSGTLSNANIYMTQ